MHRAMFGVHRTATLSHQIHVSASYEQRSQAVVEGIEAIDPEFVLHLPSSTLKLVLGPLP